MNEIITGDCVEVMKGFEENSIDCIVTDPPYGLNFMGKAWDKALPPKAAFVEMNRVLKPGALAFVMSSPRQDVMWRMGRLLEESGFSLKQSFMSWIYNVGFPKSYDIAKNIDAKQGIKNVVDTVPDRWNGMGGTYQFSQQPNRGTVPVTEPASDLAKKWQGWKSVAGLKPALEVIFMVQKPLSEKTIVDNVLKWGTGAMNVDGCRIPLNGENTQPFQFKARSTNVYGVQDRVDAPEDRVQNEKGRFPANLLVSDDALNKNGEHSPYGMFAGAEWDKSKGRFPANIVVSDDALNDGKITKSNPDYRDGEEIQSRGIYGDGYIRKPSLLNDDGSNSRYFDLDAWAEHNGILQVPKASTGERDEGLSGEEYEPHSALNTLNGTGPRFDGAVVNKRKNIHPCVKPVRLMSYLITLGCPQDGVVLDPFVGSGTTCVAAKKLGRKWIGIELDEKYVEIARGRMEAMYDDIDEMFIGEV